MTDTKRPNPYQRNRTDGLIIAMILIAGLFAVFMLAGCSNPQPAGAIEAQDIREALSVAEDASLELDAVIQAAQSDLAELPEGEARDQVLAVIADATARKASVDELVSELQTRFDAVGQDADLLDALAVSMQGAGGVVPLPWGLYLATGGSVLLAVNRWIKASRTASAAEGVVLAIEDEKRASGGTIDFANAQVKSSLRSRMKPDSIDLVEAARRKALGSQTKHSGGKQTKTYEQAIAEYRAALKSQETPASPAQ